jgi:hypothetical protein
MNTPCAPKRIIAGALLSGGVALAGFGLAAGSAQAQPGPLPLIHWCPGQPWQSLAPPPPDWDMSVCHDMKTVPDASRNPPWRVVETPPWTPPPGCPPWATIFSGPAQCGGL